MVYKHLCAFLSILGNSLVFIGLGYYCWSETLYSIIHSKFVLSETLCLLPYVMVVYELGNPKLYFRLDNVFILLNIIIGRLICGRIVLCYRI